MTAEKMDVPLDSSKESRVFEKLVIWVSTLSIAVMAGFLASLKQVNPALRFEFSATSVIACIAGGALTALFLRLVLNGSRRRRAFWVMAAAIISVVGYFLIGIKDTARENRSDVTIGTIIAVAVLSFVAWLLWRLGKFFESDRAPDQKKL